MPSGPAVLIAVGLALAPVAAGPAAAQGRIPMSTTWEEVPQVVAEGATVVVRTRDGSSVKGRVRSLSDTAIVLDGGKVRTIPAAAVASIDGRRGSRPIWKGAEAGAAVGISLWALGLALNGEVSTEALTLPVFGAAIGAAIGAFIPGKRALLYAAGPDIALGVVPTAGQGRRGAAVRVAF
jgi:hypothetical protein